MINFYKTRLGERDYFVSSTRNERIYIPCDKPQYSDLYDYYKIRNEDDYYGCQIPPKGQEVSEYCNNLLLKLLEGYGIEYDIDENSLKRVVYTWDHNLIPGEKFIGIELIELDGTEEDIIDLFPKIIMNLDILDCFRFDFSGYIGLRGRYRLYLPYTEENIEIYKEYLRVKISKRFPLELERKIKM